MSIYLRKLSFQKDLPVVDQILWCKRKKGMITLYFSFFQSTEVLSEEKNFGALPCNIFSFVSAENLSRISGFSQDFISKSVNNQHPNSWHHKNKYQGDCT